VNGSSPFNAFGIELAGRNVVDASAGTGKTYAITSLVTRLVVEKHLRIKDILVVTFTEAATSELRDRVRKRLRDAFLAFEAVLDGSATANSDMHVYATQRKSTAVADRQWLLLALEELDEAPISTIHGFCHRILQEAALASGVPFEAELLTDVRPLRDETIDDFHSSDLAQQPLKDVRELFGAESNPRELWQTLADKLLRSPDALVVPQDPFERQESWRKLCEALRGVWDRDAVSALVTAKYDRPSRVKVTDVARWICEIDELLDLQGPPTVGPKAFLHLSATAWKMKIPEAPGHPAFDVLEDMVALIAGKAGPQSVVSAKLRFAKFFGARLAERKSAVGAITFEDLLLLLREALRGSSAKDLKDAVRNRFKAALIDEFQDTDPVQFEIFQKLFDNPDQPLFLIGDPKQAIYSFRGADVHAYMGAVKSPGGRHHSMGVNWRTDPRLIAAVNALFCPRTDLPFPFVLPAIDFAPVSARPNATDVFRTESDPTPPPMEVLLACEDDGTLYNAGSRVAKLVAADIARLCNGMNFIGNKRVVPADIAVLTRSNKNAAKVQQALHELQIPAVLLGDKSVFNSEEATELLVVLAAVVEPTNAGLLRKALATSLLGLAAHQLVQLEDDAAEWSNWSNAFRQWNEIWLAQGFVQMFRCWLDHEKVSRRLLGFLDGERRVTNLLHLMELMHRAARDGHLGPAGLLHWLGQSCADAINGIASDESQIRLESDEAAVKITTVHKSKGLEYPIVYCSYLVSEGLVWGNDKKVVSFHDDDGLVKLDVGSSKLSAHVALTANEALAENVRLLYVAVTRAKHRCVLLWGQEKELKNTAFASLLFPLEGRVMPPRPGSICGDLGDLSEAMMREPLEAWSARCAGAVSSRNVPSDYSAAPYAKPSRTLSVMAARPVARPVSAWQRTTSFSAMTSGAEHGDSLFAADALARDRDQHLASPTSLAHPLQPVELNEFPKGATAGNFFHELLEVIDFQSDASDLVPAVIAQLQLFRYDEERWRHVVPRALQNILTTPLDDGRGPFSLRDISPTARISELEFALPLAAIPHAEPLQSKLADVFRVPLQDADDNRYAARVAQLPLGAINGFVKGFIDLVFEHDGRFFVLDYKTNHLGATWRNYERAAMEEAMVDGHYHLQSHLYSVAVSRHLARTVKGYEPSKHFGGVFYLFLRGMAGPKGTGTGVYFQRPSFERLQALDEIFPVGQVLS
jgi:exodeoxyribonuclease V beta subunit